MQIEKVINNNIVRSEDSNGYELIIMGCGIGFKKKPGDIVDEDKIEKVYKLQDEMISGKLLEILQSVPLEHVNTCNRIIEYAQQQLERRLSDNIYITLTDHISFAIERLENGLTYKNQLLWEITKFYPKEYSVGKQALEIIKEELGITLSKDEAGFIALHIVTAQIDSNMESTVNVTTLIQEILTIVTDFYKIVLDEESLHYERFITHLKFFGQRVFQNKNMEDGDMQFQSMVRTRYQTDYECAECIRQRVKERYGYYVSEDEMIFLTVHLRRISMSAIKI